MFRLSKLLEKLEDKLDARFKSWFARNKAKLPMRVPAVIVGWYFYGMFLNSLRLGIASTFHTGEDEIKSIWVLNPFKNWGAVFTGFGIVTTLVIILIICLITKKGYIWFSGYDRKRNTDTVVHRSAFRYVHSLGPLRDSRARRVVHERGKDSCRAVRALYAGIYDKGL